MIHRSQKWWNVGSIQFSRTIWELRLWWNCTSILNFLVISFKKTLGIEGQRCLWSSFIFPGSFPGDSTGNCWIGPGESNLNMCLRTLMLIESQSKPLERGLWWQISDIPRRMWVTCRSLVRDMYMRFYINDTVYLLRAKEITMFFGSSQVWGGSYGRGGLFGWVWWWCAWTDVGFSLLMEKEIFQVGCWMCHITQSIRSQKLCSVCPEPNLAMCDWLKCPELSKDYQWGLSWWKEIQIGIGLWSKAVNVAKEFKVVLHPVLSM